MKLILQTVIIISSIITNTGYYFLGGLGIHIWTIYLIYKVHGFTESVISFFLPVVSQLYMMVILTLNVGFYNSYNLTIIVVFIITWITPFIMIFAINRLVILEEKEMNFINNDELKQDNKVNHKPTNSIFLKRRLTKWIRGVFLATGVSLFILSAYLNKPADDSSNFSNEVVEEDTHQTEKTYPETISKAENNKNTVELTTELTSPYPEFISKFNKISTDLDIASTIWETGSDIEILEYSDYEYEVWDDLLNSIYSTLKTDLLDDQLIKLRDSQREWIIERDRIAKDASQSFKGGTFETPIYISTQANETKIRCYWLIQNYMQ